MTIVFIGLPGSGKSTQAERLAEHFGIRYIETGQLFREAATKSDDRSLRIARAMAMGDLVAKDDVEYVLGELFECLKGDAPVIVDGFPRDLAQAQEYKDYLSACIFLDVPDEVCVRRLVERNRSDDEPYVINLRIRHFWERTEPMLEWLRKEGLVTYVDGNRDPEVIFDDLKRILGELLRV